MLALHAGVQQPERIFRPTRNFVLVSAGNVDLVTHAERQSLSFNRLRRSQVRIVLSGTL